MLQHPSKWGCPYDCGICTDHEQHACTLLLEVTDHCNLRCPTCYANSSPERITHRSLENIIAMLDLAVKNEGEPNIIQLSGGEPTLHPDFFEIIKTLSHFPFEKLAEFIIAGNSGYYLLTGKKPVNR